MFKSPSIQTISGLLPGLNQRKHFPSMWSLSRKTLKRHSQLSTSFFVNLQLISYNFQISRTLSTGLYSSYLNMCCPELRVSIYTMATLSAHNLPSTLTMISDLSSLNCTLNPVDAQIPVPQMASQLSLLGKFGANERLSPKRWMVPVK